MGHEEMRLTLWEPSALLANTAMRSGLHRRKTTTNMLGKTTRAQTPQE